MRDTMGARTLLAIVLAALLLACERGDGASVDTALTKAVEALGAATDSVASRLASRAYSNAELAGFINTYNDAEIQMGELAQAKATESEVRTFAQQIVTEHRALRAEVTRAARSLDIDPAVAGDIENITERHQEGMRDLNDRAAGRGFDEAYLRHEIRMHRSVLEEIEDTLGRNRNPELRTLLEKVRDGVRAHLAKAEELEKKVTAA